MHEIDITDFWLELCASDYSASVAEIGQSAGPDTWQASIENATEYPILTDSDALQAMRDHALSSGGWDEDEVSKWSDTELRALALQWLSGDIREAFMLSFGQRPDPADWPDVMARAENGQCSGSIGPGDNGRVYWSIGE